MLELSGRERELVQELVRDASAVLREHGAPSSEATLDAVAQTLHAAAIDADAADAVEQGRLVKERRAIGLGLGGGEAAPAKPAAKRDTKAGARQASRKAAAAARARERVAAAEQELKDAQAELRRAQSAVRDAERGAEKAAGRERRAAAALTKLRRS